MRNRRSILNIGLALFIAMFVMSLLTIGPLSNVAVATDGTTGGGPCPGANCISDTGTVHPPDPPPPISQSLLTTMTLVIQALF